MNRCLVFLRIPALALVISLAGASALAPVTALAQGLVRPFPKAALRGMLEVTAPPQVLINGQPARLSPGARIKGTNNLIVMSGTLVGRQLLVNYVRDAQGLLHDVWILTPAEAQEKRPGQETLSNIRFESDADRIVTGTVPVDGAVR